MWLILSKKTTGGKEASGKIRNRKIIRFRFSKAFLFPTLHSLPAEIKDEPFKKRILL